MKRAMTPSRKAKGQLPGQVVGKPATDDCKHLNAAVNGYNLMGQAHCPDCQRNVQLSTVFNNLLNAMREALRDPDSSR